jgi:hypothetical protein
MANSTQQDQSHFGEGVRNTLIFLLIFGLIALVTYMEWKGRLGH